MEYFAFGETFVEEHSNTDKTPYLFNGKELDEETGLYYYGARYYDPKTSVWTAIDPLAEKYSHLSPYVYVANNPICATDPDGKRIYFIPGLGYDPQRQNSPYVKGVSDELEPYLGQHGTYSRTIQGSKNGRLADMGYVAWRGQAPRSNPFNDRRAVMAASAIAADLNSHPLQEGEQFNILGTSQGSVTSAHAVILLLENPEAFGLSGDIKVDNLVLAGSPLSKGSKLYKRLLSLQEAGKIGNILYDDYQSKDSYGNYNDNVTGLAGTSRMGAIGRGLKFIGQIIKAVSGKGPPHPHFEAAENRSTDPQYGSFGEQIKSQLSKDEVH
jgi:RHS repeat-associated protein